MSAEMENHLTNQNRQLIQEMNKQSSLIRKLRDVVVRLIVNRDVNSEWREAVTDAEMLLHPDHPLNE